MQKKNELFTTMPVGRAVAKLAVPTVISQIVVILYSLADTFFVGQIGAPNQLAALKIPCCDSELIEKIAIETGFAKEYVERFGEYAVSDSLYDNALAGRTYDGKSDADKLWLAQKDVITRLAKEGSCVIVGRCSDFILRDIADCLSVFIHASDEKRAERIVSVYGRREEAPAKRLHDKDRKRRAYYELYTGTSWGDIANYTICLDSGVLGTDKCVEIIKGLY